MDDLQKKELAARLMAHNCPVYASGKSEPDSMLKATISGQRSAACGERWMAARLKLINAGLDPLPLPRRRSVMDSTKGIDHGPAVTHRVKGHKKPEFDYPARFNDRVPKTVRVKRTVRSDALVSLAKGRELVAEGGRLFYAWTNSHGAVSALLPNGEKLGLYPHEFEVVEWLDGEA